MKEEGCSSSRASFFIVDKTPTELIFDNVPDKLERLSFFLYNSRDAINLKE